MSKDQAVLNEYQVSGDDVDPDLDGKRIKEREETGTFSARSFEEDADAEVHKRLREVDDFLAQIADR